MTSDGGAAIGRSTTAGDKPNSRRIGSDQSSAKTSIRSTERASPTASPTPSTRKSQASHDDIDDADPAMQIPRVSFKSDPPTPPSPLAVGRKKILNIATMLVGFSNLISCPPCMFEKILLGKF